MPLFKTQAQIREFIKVSFTTTDSSLPKQISAEEEYIIPIIGQTIFNGLQTEANGSPGLSTATPLLKKVWAALAYLAYYKELPFINAQLSESGVKQVNTDKFQSAYRWQYNELKANIENEGMAAQERLLQYMIDNHSNDTAWTNSDAYKRLNKNLLRTGTDFSRYFTLLHKHRCFYHLQPIVQEIEDFFIIPSLGDSFFTALKTAATPTDDEKVVIDLLKKATANLTIYQALKKQTVILRPEGAIVTLGAAADAYNAGEGNAPQADKMASAHSIYNDGSSYLTQAIDYLNQKASSTVFATWFTGPKYIDPTATVSSVNTDLKGVFVM
jgi:hypothetical protein